jgi:hypothetical protein
VTRHRPTSSQSKLIGDGILFDLSIDQFWPKPAADAIGQGLAGTDTEL